MEAGGVIFLLLLFAALGFFIRWWFWDRRKSGTDPQTPSQPVEPKTTANLQHPTSASVGQESPQVELTPSHIPEAEVVWVSPLPSAPPLPDNTMRKTINEP
jgi:hypothetical protein